MRKDKNLFLFGIRTLDGDQLIGNCSLMQTDWRNRKAVLGIGIGDKAYWGKGYGSEATALLMEYAFDELNLHRVELEVYDFNERARRAYEKVGFVHEGICREALFRDGAYHDIHIMGLLREDWVRLHNEKGNIANDK